LRASEQVFVGKVLGSFPRIHWEEHTVETLRGDFAKFLRLLDLVEVQGGYGENVRRFKAQEGQSVVESQGPSDLHVISCIGDSRVEAPNLCKKNCDIAIRDIPTSPGPFIVEDVRQEIQGSRGSENRGFRG
jgi:hypothetical protein